MKGVLDAYKELANTTNGLGAGSKEETGATWTAPFANGKIGVMPYPNTSTTALFDAEEGRRLRGSALLRSRAPRKARPPRSSAAMPWVSPRTPSTLLRPGTSSTG